MPQTEALNEISVSTEVLLSQIVQQLAPLAHHLEKSPSRVVIFAVNFQVFG